VATDPALRYAPIVSSLRSDPHSGDLVAVSPGRALRPGPTRPAAELLVQPSPDAPPCPFCGGHEQETPPEVLALGRPPGAPRDSPGWRVRVVPNLYPALSGGDGAHEVAVHGPEHRMRLAETEPDVLPLVAQAWSQRAHALAESGLPGVVAGVNEGRRAGSSLEHSHSQLVATAAPPPRLARELDLAAGGADVLDTPLDGPRVVARRAGIVAFTPYAARFGHELRLAPEEPAPDAFADPEALAAALELAVQALDASLGAVPFNLVLHSRPAGVHTPFRWHLEVLPRLGVQAMIELGAGILVCHVDPDASAEAYRSALARRA
jgi:UDPglucose--hexose-1-phosphate uridylyltransferase